MEADNCDKDFGNTFKGVDGTSLKLEDLEELQRSPPNHWSTDGSTRRSAEKGGSACSPKRRDRIIARHHMNLKQWQAQVLLFLEQNHFTKVNSAKGFLFITYPLHEAVKQKNAMMVKLLLSFGADPTLKDHFGRTAFYYGRHQEDIVQVFEKCACAPGSPRFSRGSRLQRTPPPIGFEEFFAKLEKDPMVSTPSNEGFWLRSFGARHLRSKKRGGKSGDVAAPLTQSRVSTTCTAGSTKTSL
eukprot:symbB.v1.2.027859.t1/scaffold2892.1/size67796/1